MGKTAWNRDAVYQLLKFASKRRDEWIDGVDGELSFPTESHTDLVAAAQDLLEALENLINNCECRETGTAIADFSRKTPVDAARAAIAKAKGVRDDRN